ncbi:hypothetical protein D3C73_744290 [compost metagenome]
MSDAQGFNIIQLFRKSRIRTPALAAQFAFNRYVRGEIPYMDFINNSILAFLVAGDIPGPVVRRVRAAQVNDSRLANRITVWSCRPRGVHGEHSHRLGIGIKHRLGYAVIGHLILIVIAAHIVYCCSLTQIRRLELCRPDAFIA